MNTLELDKIYGHSLLVAVSVMLFIGIYFLFAKTPEKPIYESYRRSRRIMGLAVVLLGLNYAMHLVCGLRFRNVNAAILLNLSTYYMTYWLCISALMMLLDRFYLSAARLIRRLVMWLLFTAFAIAVLLVMEPGTLQKVCVWIMALWLLGYGAQQANTLFKTYRRAVRLFDDTHSEHIAAYIKWLSTLTYLTTTYGASCGLLTFLPDRYIYIWVLASIAFYVYLFCAYMNYLLFYEEVENILETEEYIDPVTPDEIENDGSPACFVLIGRNMEQWIAKDGFLQQGITINHLAAELMTNRTYLSAYIKATYKVSFREWITDLRMEYAKKLMLEHPEYTVGSVSDKSGYLSQSNFMRLFKEKEGCTPSQWRKARTGSAPAE